MSIRKAAWLLAVAGCAVPVVAVTPEGRLPVLGPEPGFSLQAPPPGWVMRGDAAARLVVVEERGVPALRIGGGPDTVLAIRRTQATLLATPYLSWAWKVQAQDTGPHPVRLVVGFRGGRPGGDDGGFTLLPPVLPDHDRVLAIAWGDSALRRGHLDRASPEPRVAADPFSAPPVVYTQRGGRENADGWWLETVDLADLYARAWPADEVAAVEVVFVGLEGAAGSPSDPVARLAGVLLSR